MRRDGPLRIWVLRATGIGAARQLSNLASALAAELGGVIEYQDVLDGPVRAFCGRLRPGAVRSLPVRKAARLHPPWPDVVLFGGGRSLLDAMRVRYASGGRSRIICIGRPGAPLSWVDLTITTPQYRLPPHPRVLQLNLPLSVVADGNGQSQAVPLPPAFADLPRPWYAVLVGGASGSYRFDADTGRALGQAVNALARETAGALLISGSPRTPEPAIDALLAALHVPHYCYLWRPDDPENPLPAMLALGDGFVVTADSASMLTEACATGRPVAGFEPPRRWRARLLGAARRSRPLAVSVNRRLTWLEQLTAAGLWFPARDMDLIYRELHRTGMICDVAQLPRQPARPQLRSEGLDRAVHAIGALLGR